MSVYFIIGFFLLAVAQHPFITYPMSLIIWKMFLQSGSPNQIVDFSKPPSISVLCCCHNEENVIDKKVQNIAAAQRKYFGSTQALFFLDGCTDRTEKILSGVGGGIEVVVSHERVGKSVGMRKLVSQSLGDILAFTDANTFISDDTFVHLATVFSDPNIGGVAGSLSYSNPGESEVARVNSAYWGYEELIKKLESDTGMMVGADGAFFAIRRELYVPTPPDIIDDLYTSMNVVFQGRSFVSIPQIRTFERTATARRDEFNRKVRIGCRAFNCYRYFSGRLHRSGAKINYKFYSHKVIRWLCFPVAVAGFLFLLAGLLSIGATWAVLVSVAAVTGIALAGYLGFWPFSAFYEVLLNFVAVSLGVFQSLRGVRYQVWSIAQSGR